MFIIKNNLFNQAVVNEEQNKELNINKQIWIIRIALEFLKIFEQLFRKKIKRNIVKRNDLFLLEDKKIEEFKEDLFLLEDKKIEEFKKEIKKRNILFLLKEDKIEEFKKEIKKFCNKTQKSLLIFFSRIII